MMDFCNKTSMELSLSVRPVRLTLQWSVQPLCCLEEVKLIYFGFKWAAKCLFACVYVCVHTSMALSVCVATQFCVCFL